jgi:acyl-CoA synthetase (AMP-forming)/AMP-acid ligase II
VRPLARLLQEPADPDSPVARRWDPASRGDLILDRAALRGHVAALRRRLDAEPAGSWLLVSDDAYTFAVGLLALWHSGRHAVSPPNTQPGTLRELETRVAGVLSDRPDWFPERACLHPLLDGGAGEPSELAPLDPEALGIELFTSGTTGAAKPVTKRIRHLADEVEELGAMWNEPLGDAVVFATASHQHLYGLLFGVLWPLCAGRVFQAEHFLHPGELVPRMREAGQCALASVPTHLRRLARRGDLAGLRGRCHAVFSSGGILPGETARRVEAALGRPPLEVLGSTETGGIAWRRQDAGREESPWTPLPRVEIGADPHSGSARVRSPFVSTDHDGGGFATGDRIALAGDGRFRLEGRADRVVKVGEKRLDLMQMESRLRGHPLVADAALTTVERDGEPRVAAALVPTDAGWELLGGEGLRALGRALAADLAEDWDPVLHPRLWRPLRCLPESPQGKVSAAALRALFGRLEAGAAPGEDRPFVLEERRGEDFVERSCRVPPDLCCFAGHFPDVAVVPGVLQLDWALELAAELLGHTPSVEAIESLKFRSALGPGAPFRVRVRAEPRRVDLRLWWDAEEYALGVLRLAPRRERSA